jgi:uncharacterized membrane protein YfcA
VSGTDVLLVATVAVAAFAQALTGFGFALLAAPVIVALLAPVPAVSAVAILGLVVNAAALVADRRAPAVLRGEATVLLRWAVLGLPLGALVLTRLPADAIRVMVAVMVLVALAQRWLATRKAWAVPAPAAGVLAGALTTSTGLNGPPLVLRLLAIDAEARARRHTLAVLFLALGALGVITLAAGGELGPPHVLPALAGAAVLGAAGGARAAGRLASHVEERLVGALLVAAAATALVSGLA